MKKLICFILCIFISASLAVPACAEDEEPAGDGSGLIDSDELSARVQAYLKENKLPEQNFSIGYHYTGTDETWYMNENNWCYGASLYKVPLMMLVESMVYSGEIASDEVIGGYKLDYLEELILTYSSNDMAHMVMDHFWPDNSEALRLETAYSDLPMEEYPNNFFASRYFSARYITDVFKTLYRDPDKYPGVMDCLLAAQPDQYFRYTLEGTYDIAQKYGSLNENNHTGGIIFTPNPIILTVMTRNLSASGAIRIIGELAQIFVDYTLEMDAKLDDYKAEQERLAIEAEAKRKEEAEAEARAAAEQSAQPPATQEPVPTPSAVPVQPETEADSAPGSGRLLSWVIAGIILCVVLLLITSGGKRSGRKRRRRSARHIKTHE